MFYNKPLYDSIRTWWRYTKYHEKRHKLLLKIIKKSEHRVMKTGIWKFRRNTKKTIVSPSQLIEKHNKTLKFRVLTALKIHSKLSKLQVFR